MTSSVFTPPYAAFLQTLIAVRNDQGLTQVELARRLGKPQQFISRYEQGLRRLDLVEFYAIAKALGVDPVATFARIIEVFPDVIAI